MLHRLRIAGLAATLLGGAVLFAYVMGQHYPIGRWLFWRYAGYWATVLTWAACCGSLGYAMLARFAPRFPVLDRVTLGFPLGVTSFGFAIFFLGLAHALGRVTFFALPLAFGALGFRDVRRDWGALRRTLQSCLSPRRSLGSFAVAALGLLGVGLLYFQIITPDGLSFDSRWYHLPMAQRYALSGAVERWEEGFWMAAYPQLATYLFTWVFLAPLPVLFDRIELCAHLDFVLFLLTLAQVPVLVRKLVPGARTGLTWTVLLAFPAIYLYDSNLHAGADHIAAFFAIPIALTFWKAWHSFQVRNVLLFSVFVSAAALTKYTALIIVVPAGLALLGRALYLSGSQRTRPVLLGLLALVTVPLALTSIHWLKNWVWYGDPIYPILHRFLALRPWSADAATQLAILEQVGRPGSLTKSGLSEAAKTTLTFSFVANDWYAFRQDVPLFGSLFTLTLPCLLFVRGARRIVWLYALSMSAVFVWFLLSHYERFLQVVLPWMAVATAACLLRVWQVGLTARLALVPLLVLQVVWGSDAPFIRTHNLIGDSPVRRVAQFIPSGFEKVKGRLSVYEPLPTLGKAIPKDGVVLAHDVMMILGIDRNWVTDLHQSRISYGKLLEPAAIDRELKSLGVTHLIWPQWSVGRDSLAGDLAFLNYAVNYTRHDLVYGGHTVATLPEKAPVTLGGDRVALYACGGVYPKGWYHLNQLTLPTLNPGRAPKRLDTLGALEGAAATADYIVTDTNCDPGTPPKDFVMASARGTLLLYVRNRRPAGAKP